MQRETVQDLDRESRFLYSLVFTALFCAIWRTKRNAHIYRKVILMDRLSKLHRKIIIALSQLMEDEEAELTKLRRIRMVYYWLGMLLVIASLFEARDPQWPVWVFTLMGATGGLVVGLGFHYDNSINQWPAIKPFMDREKIIEAVKEYHLE